MICGSKYDRLFSIARWESTHTGLFYSELSFETRVGSFFNWTLRVDSHRSSFFSIVICRSKHESALGVGSFSIERWESTHTGLVLIVICLSKHQSALFQLSVESRLTQVFFYYRDLLFETRVGSFLLNVESRLTQLIHLLSGPLLTWPVLYLSFSLSSFCTHYLGLGFPNHNRIYFRTGQWICVSPLFVCDQTQTSSPSVSPTPPELTCELGHASRSDTVIPNRIFVGGIDPKVSDLLITVYLKIRLNLKYELLTIQRCV